MKQKCVDIKLSLRCKPTGKQLCDVTVYVTVDSPLSAHLSTRSFSAVGKIMRTHHLHSTMRTQILFQWKPVLHWFAHPAYYLLIVMSPLCHCIPLLKVHNTYVQQHKLLLFLGLQRSIQFTVTPPLGLFCDPCLPVKESQFKVYMLYASHVLLITPLTDYHGNQSSYSGSFYTVS